MVAACPFPVNYGSPGAIRELTETLAEMGHDLHVVTYGEGDALPVGNAQLHRVAKINSQGPRVGPTRHKLFTDILLVIELCKVIRKYPIEIIHAHNYEGCIAGVLAKFVTGRPLIYNAVNLMSEELATYKFFKPAFIGKWLAAVLDWFVPIFPDHIIAVTQTLYDWHAAHGVKKDKLTFIPCGVRPSMFDGADPSALLRRYGIGPRPVVMYTGIHTAFQRVDYLLRAFTVVLKEEPSAILMIVSPLSGEPNYPANVELAKSLGISGNVIFAGPHDLAELPNYLAMATVTVVPRPECHGHPIKLLNYMMAAKPIVCFEGAAKGVRHLHDAYLVPDHDWKKMGEAIVALLRDPALAKELAAHAHETVINNFDWRILAKKIEAIYAQLLAKK
jgi:glycosyltransferase involved in cell wall biosynthesis